MTVIFAPEYGWQLWLAALVVAVTAAALVAAMWTPGRRHLGAARPTYYLAIPPSLFPVVVDGLARSGCAKNARLVVEKPFGRDRASDRKSVV